MANGDNKFRSRKFITTNFAMVLGAALQVAGLYSTTPDGYWSSLPSFFILCGVSIGAYNWANTKSAEPR